jgi:beta-lactamase family protein
MKKATIYMSTRSISRAALATLNLTLWLSIARSSDTDSVSIELHQYLSVDTNKEAGILFGRLDSITSVPHIWAIGAIDKDNDLRLGCPTAKPCLAYIILKEGVDLTWTIDRWFPEQDGFTKSRSIAVKHLLLNSSGIRDFTQLVPMNPDSVVTPTNSIDRAYRHQPLLFEPGQSFEYSNTNFNIVGLILERHTGMTVTELFKKYFCSFAPSIRLDDGKGNYPQGYVKPWPYHWSSPGFAGGFIGTATDAMRVFTYIASQAEFKVMTRWYRTDGSLSIEAGAHLLGFGVFGTSEFGGLGEAAIYEGDMGPSQMILARIKGSTFCIYSSHNVGGANLAKLFQKLVHISDRGS